MLNRRRFLALTTLASSTSLPLLSACTSDAKQSDVVIIGAGHSGLAAAVSAAQQGAKVTVIGEENVPKDQAVLYVANHRSYFDILLTYSRCPIRTGYVAKKEMEHYPLLSNWMRNLYCLFLDREDIKQGLKTILQAADYVKSGISVCIFPEGTRNKNADETEMLPFHDGSFKIAARAKSPIIPIAISNSANIWEANFPKMTPTHVVIEYGKPIIPSELDRDTQRHLGSYTQDIIKEMLIKNKELV